MQKKFFYPADILLPKDNFTEWSVIACDQYTSQPDYWAEVKNTVGDKPSALILFYLRLIYPMMTAKKSKPLMLQ
jgi:hypothetical protein